VQAWKHSGVIIRVQKMSFPAGTKEKPLDLAGSPGWELILRLEAGRKDPDQRLLTKLATTIRLTVFTVYRRLLLVIIAANLIGVLVVAIRSESVTKPSLNTLASAGIANFAVAVVVRQDYVINALFATCWNVSHAAPLGVRQRLARVYENGGVHSGCAIGATLWTVAFWGLLARDALEKTWRSAVVLGTSLVLLILLLVIIVGALPPVRRRHHNVFENTHRLGGWACILLYWPTLLLSLREQSGPSVANGRSFVLVVIRAPAFWMLLVITANVVYPWLLLRRVPVTKVERLSDHAVRLYFSSKERIPALHAFAISDAPLHEWHSFAAIPDTNDREGGSSSCIVSKAGDWTAETIRNPRESYYMRGVHKAGVLGMAKVFRSVVLMATGSGIGPCLSIFGQTPDTKVRVIWSAPEPTLTFGKNIYASVLQCDPHAVIFNTRNTDERRPDLVQEALNLYHSENAEAVFFISNRSLTKKVVDALTLKGVPVFAPVFDS
jgi:hypothetical protein